MKKFISYDESISIVNGLSVETFVENIHIIDSLGRVLADDILAKFSSPEVPTSAMDGYAIKYSDIDNDLEIVDINPAGGSASVAVTTNTCVKTMTGAIIPAGADTLVPIENIQKLDNGKIRIVNKVKQGFAIREVGENFRTGDKVISKDTIIDFAEIGVLASLNVPQIKVYKKPTVSILCTGSEIIDLGEIQTSLSQIRSSNHLTIQALANKYGANTVQMGIVQDNYEEIRDKIRQALAISDIVVTTGGVSVGDYDFVKDIIKKDLGAEVLFGGVNIKPGQHVVLAKKDNKFIIGLPGFAYSSTVTAILYLIPLIKKYQNNNKPMQMVKAKLLENYNNKFGKTTLKACNLTYTNGKYLVDFIDKKDGTSAILTNLINGCYLMVSSSVEETKEVGDFVDVLIV